MNGDGIIINLEDRKKSVIKDARFVAGGPPSQDAIALAFVRLYGDRYRYVPAWQRWIGWDGKRWAIDHHNAVSATIRTIIREAVGGTRHERRIATANYIRGAEQMARYDPAVVLQPSALDADPWLLNTQADIVNLRDGSRHPHDPAALITRITAAAPADAEGEALWAQFLVDITQGDATMSAYLQRVAGYCASGVTSEDILPYFFGVGSNGKSSFAETLMAALGDYALVFAPEVMMEARGERHPTELAQFMGVRLALCKLLRLWRNQNKRCTLCDQLITKETGWNIHHRTPKCEGGADNFVNLILLHPNCHRQLHAVGLTLESRPL